MTICHVQGSALTTICHAHDKIMWNMAISLQLQGLCDSCRVYVAVTGSAWLFRSLPVCPTLSRNCFAWLVRDRFTWRCDRGVSFFNQEAWDSLSIIRWQRQYNKLSSYIHWSSKVTTSVLVRAMKNEYRAKRKNKLSQIQVYLHVWPLSNLNFKLFSTVTLAAWLGNLGRKHYDYWSLVYSRAVFIRLTELKPTALSQNWF